MIKTLIIRWVARNLDTLIDFLNGLDDQLDAYVAAQDQKAQEIDNQIADLLKEQASVIATGNTAKNLQSGVQNITKA